METRLVVQLRQGHFHSDAHIIIDPLEQKSGMFANLKLCPAYSTNLQLTGHNLGYS